MLQAVPRGCPFPPSVSPSILARLLVAGWLLAVGFEGLTRGPLALALALSLCVCLSLSLSLALARSRSRSLSLSAGLGLCVIAFVPETRSPPPPLGSSAALPRLRCSHAAPSSLLAPSLPVCPALPSLPPIPPRALVGGAGKLTGGHAHSHVGIDNEHLPEFVGAAGVIVVLVSLVGFAGAHFGNLVPPLPRPRPSSPPCLSPPVTTCGGCAVR
jgi:hypothetical protein